MIGCEELFTIFMYIFIVDTCFYACKDSFVNCRVSLILEILGVRMCACVNI